MKSPWYIRAGPGEDWHWRDSCQKTQRLRAQTTPLRGNCIQLMKPPNGLLCPQCQQAEDAALIQKGFDDEYR